MENANTILEELRESGSSFNYDNFSQKGQYGYPSALKPEWLIWTGRIESIVSKLIGDKSTVAGNIRIAKKIQLIGNGDDKFMNVHARYMAAIETVIGIVGNDTFGELVSQNSAIAPHDLTNKVFIVHGHDSLAKNELEVLLREFGLEPVVLHRQVDSGNTIIEKFEKHADVGFAFVLLTPDEIAFLATEKALPDGERATEYRARPNVIFEFGYFVGRIGRKRTCCIYRGDVVPPSDLSGLLYKKYSESIEEVAYSIRKELLAAGYALS